MLNGKMNKFFLVIIAVLLFSNSFIYSQTKNEEDLQIVGGKSIKIENAPWQIALFRFDEQSGQISTQFCGGTIIDEYWILTAAHCVKGVKVNQIRVVASTTTLTDASSVGQIMEVAEIIVHDQYNSDTINNDIALIRLQNPLDLSTLRAKSVPIMTKADEDNGFINPGVVGIISGWGSLTYHGDSPDSLQAVSIPIISNDTANKWFKESDPNGEQGTWDVTETMIAMGLENGGISGCHGDSGGPFVVKNADNDWSVAGVTSWGKICGDPKMPSVYTKVSYFENYIMEHTNFDAEPSLDDYVEIIKYDGDSLVSSCEGLMEWGTLLVRNFGKNPLEKFDIHTIISDYQNNIIYDKTFTYSFDEPIPTGASRLINFIDTNITELGNYRMTVSVSKANGSEIVGAIPSSIQHNFTVIEATVVNLQVKVNATGQYTFWSIYNAETQQAIQQVSYNQNDIGQIYNYSFCLPNGIYYFQLMAFDGNCDYNLSIKSNDIDYILTERISFTNFDFVLITVPFIPITNIALSSEGQIPDSMSVCDLNYKKDITLNIQNLGSLPIKKIQGEFYQNNQKSNFEITEYLTPGSSTTLPLNNITFIDKGVNTFSAEVTVVEAQVEEEDLSDNKAELEIYIEKVPQVAKLSIFSEDENGRYEWMIYNKNNKIVLGGDAKNNSNIFIENLCLPPGCYKIFVNDKYGEGIPSTIGAKITDNKGNTIVEIPGSMFKDYNSFEFCVFESSVTDDFMMKNLNIYPNPASDRFQIDYYSNYSGKINIEIFNVLGMMVYKFEPKLVYGRNAYEINTNMLPNGVYNVKLSNEGRIAVKQIVINK